MLLAQASSRRGRRGAALAAERQSAALRRANQELGRRNQELDRLHRTAHRFVENVSHDLRTPLAVVREYASLLREGALGEVNAGQPGVLDTIVQRTDELTSMVNDVLDLSRLDAGLLAWCYAMIVAFNGQAGLGAALENQPDAIIMDMRMPLMDGLRMLTEMRREARMRRIPVIVLPGFMRDDDKRSALRLGASYLIEKPYDSLILIEAVGR